MWAVSEMLPANIITRHPEKSGYRLEKHPDEGPLVYQLSGNCPATLGEATAYLTENHPASGIDLNAGCPKKKIRKKGCGSALLSNADLLFTILSTMRAHTPFLTVKIRIDGPFDHYTEDVIAAAYSAGADALIMHARNWQDTDATPCHWDQAAMWVNTCSIPVIINGNLYDQNNIKDFIKHTGALGAMIARGTCGRPWLMGQIQGKEEPSTREKYKTLITHLQDINKLIGPKHAYLQSQSLLRYYERHLPSLRTCRWQDTLTFDERILCLERARLGGLTQ